MGIFRKYAEHLGVWASVEEFGTHPRKARGNSMSQQTASLVLMLYMSKCR